MFIYVISAIIFAIVLASIVIVAINGIDRNKRINLNWLVLMVAIALGCALIMVVIYHNQHDLTAFDIQTSYDRGYEDGVASASHTYPNNEEMEEWFSKTEKVVVGSNGNDTAVHIIDGQGEEWVLYVDETINK